MLTLWRRKRNGVLLLPDYVPAAPGTHACRMHRVGRHIGRALASDIRPGRPAARQRHLALENNVRGINGVRVVRVRGVRSILPDVDVAEAFVAQLLLG